MMSSPIFTVTTERDITIGAFRTLDKAFDCADSIDWRKSFGVGSYAKIKWWEGNTVRSVYRDSEGNREFGEWELTYAAQAAQAAQEEKSLQEEKISADAWEKAWKDYADI